MVKKIIIVVLIVIAVPVIFFRTYFHRTDLPLLAELSGESGPILIEHASIFTGRPADRVLNNANILIKDGKITEISEKMIHADGVRKIDASGKMVIPGLIDSHTHIQLAGDPSSLPSAPNIERNLTAFLYAGVTSVMDMGADLKDIEKTAGSLEKNELSGPRLFYAGPMLTKKGGHPAAMIRLSVFWPLSAMAVSSFTREIEQGTDVEKIVSENIKHGARWTKIMRDDIPLGVPCLDVKDLKKIAEVSAKYKVPVFAHVATEEDINICLDAGIKYFAHSANMSALSDATIARMKKENAVVIATLAVYDSINQLALKKLVFSPMDREIADPRFIEEYLKGQDKHTHPAMIEWAKEVLKYQDIKFDNLRRMKKAGITIIAGSDSPNTAMTPGSSIHHELELLVKRCGFSPVEAVAAATSVPSDHYSSILGNAGYGCIKAGGSADLVILEKDFRDNILNTALINTVIQKGRLVRRIKP